MRPEEPRWLEKLVGLFLLATLAYWGWHLLLAHLR